MVFSSFPVYLDHPNLHQFQQPDHQQGSSGVENNQLPPPPPPRPLTVGGGGGGSIRPGSMVDRARLAKLPLPEAGQKCPRCNSTNTKFCYFNNYSLSQPRHFCKTCRRYWTRGGALRNVPVGGGCRRNKKSKNSSSSKSSITATSASPSTDMSGHFPQQTNQSPLMAALQNLNHYGGPHISPTIGGFQAGSLANMGFNLGENGNDLPAGGGHEQWRLLPSIAGGFEPPTSLFPFQGEGVVEAASSLLGDQQIIGSLGTSSEGISQMASVKTEENPSRLNLMKQFLVNSAGNNQFWAGSSPWTGFSGLNCSSTSHLL
ncbi:hypothetical protein ACH5RR_010059 [Cinchona calisaya]|uniref:Dof zinc finger protein n=1 Tax=Cinchona calisaya TaxID=153742 RepID=A0ABD3AHY8_9GENT